MPLEPLRMCECDWAFNRIKDDLLKTLCIFLSSHIFCFHACVLLYVDSYVFPCQMCKTFRAYSQTL